MREMKRWHLKLDLPNGLVYKGWINTFPDESGKHIEKLKGKFWGCCDEAGWHGYFILDGQTEEEAKAKGQYLITEGVYPKAINLGRPPVSRQEAEMVLNSLQPVTGLVPYFEGRLEKYVQKDKTHIITC